MAHPPRIPVWLRWDQPVVWFVTICEKDNRRVWNNPIFFEAFRAATEKLERRNLWFVRSAVIMPDHLHLLVSPLKSRDQKVGNLSAALKRWTNDELSTSFRRNWTWQAGAFDRLLRKGEFAHQKWEYMRDNPVRAGLESDWKDWPYSLGIREPKDFL